MKKRLGIYATYDKEGYVEGYIEYCLNQLSAVTDCLIVVSNETLNGKKEKHKLAMAKHIYERSDQGFDMGGFAHVINNLIARDKLKEYDELVLMNDSVFGPFYPFSDMFEKMDQRPELDFWGITKRGISDFDGGEEIYPEHIQLYFYVIREQMLHSQEFMDYWKCITEQVTDFRSAIINYEFAFTKHFQDSGYLWDVYCNIEKYDTADPKLNLSPYHYSTYELIKDKKCPLMKRKLFTGDFIEGKYSDKMDLQRAFDYIDRYTDYDIELIWSHILRVYSIGDIMESLHLNHIIGDFNEENEEEFEKINILNLSQDHADILNPKLFGAAANNNFDSKYTLVIKVEVDHEQPDVLKQAKIRCVIENMIAGQGYIRNLLRLFQTSSRLGVLIPPMKTFGDVKNSIEKRWGDTNKAKLIYDKLNLHVPIKVEYAPVHKIDAFWCRSNLLNEKIISELNHDFSGTMMQMMPLVAQEAGYYTEVLINEKYFPSILTNMQSLLRDIWGTEGTVSCEDADIDGMKNEIYKKTLMCFCKNKQAIYVYGAGQLAYRAIHIIKEFADIEAVVVSDKNGNSEKICGYPVKNIAELENVNKNIGIVVAVGRKNNKTVENILKKLKLKEYVLLG